jgi:hypothetical protein
MAKASKSTHTASREAFIAAARVAEADEDEKRWEERLKAVAKPLAKPAKTGAK